ncbi:hypothetical protein K0M31_005901 [Melipona bicolor]|uniref:Uncharacterized protein n=1 Tax=Melipona bicolor TaxID=60889 RepID=A0AA40FUH9_9HYME|nr:hypothetical protein K0M31_005901 [Melipona bicolor]
MSAICKNIYTTFKIQSSCYTVSSVNILSLIKDARNVGIEELVEEWHYQSYRQSGNVTSVNLAESNDSEIDWQRSIKSSGTLFMEDPAGMNVALSGDLRAALRPRVGFLGTWRTYLGVTGPSGSRG